MKAHILQHVPFEDIGSIHIFLKERCAAATYTRFFENESLPEVDGLDLVIVMGGPMSVHDEASLPWLRSEKGFIREAVRRNVSVLGICLGAQLIANALGAQVYRNSHKEIGWFPVLSANHGEDYFRFPNQFLAFHWHGETFDLPPGAALLAESEACKNQAFQIGRRVLGLQFHLETTPESLQALVDNCREELVSGPYIQKEETMLNARPSVYPDIHALMSELLSYLTSK